MVRGIYKLVVVAKGSKVGHRAAKKAAEIARRKNIDTIYLLFVNDTDFFSGKGLGFVKEDLTKSLGNIGEIILSQLEHVIKEENPSVNVVSIEIYGKTAQKILEFVYENSVETIIIPKEKRGPIERSLIGGDVGPFIGEIEKKANCIIVD